MNDLRITGTPIRIKTFFQRIIRRFRRKLRPTPEFFHKSADIHAAVYTVLDIAERYHDNLMAACGQPYFPKQQAIEELAKFFSNFDRVRTEQLANLKDELLGKIIREAPVMRIDREAPRGLSVIRKELGLKEQND